MKILAYWYHPVHKKDTDDDHFQEAHDIAFCIVYDDCKKYNPEGNFKQVVYPYYKPIDNLLDWKGRTLLIAGFPGDKQTPEDCF